MTGASAPMTLGGGWRTRAILIFQLVATAALISMLPMFVIFRAWADARALNAEWAVSGSSCAVVERPASWALNGRGAPMRFTYGDATFTRQFAAVSCADLPEAWWWPRRSYQVCMFSNPGAVTVGTVDGPITFQPPYGQAATITVRDGRASCVVGARFKP